MNYFPIIIVARIVAILAWLAVSTRNLREIIMIWSKHTRWIRSIPDTGRVEVVGKAEGNTINSPITDTPCLLWQIAVMEKITTQRGERSSSTYWATTFIKSSGDCFYVNDGNGRLLIQPDQAEVVLSNRGFYENPEEKICRILEKLGVEKRYSIGLEKALQ